MKKYSREEIENGVRKAVARVFLYGDLDEVKLDCLISDLCGFDSQGCYYIGLRITAEFGISIPDNEATAFAGWTISELCDYVEERTKERGLAARLEAMQKQVEEMQKQRNQQKR